MRHAWILLLFKLGSPQCRLELWRLHPDLWSQLTPLKALKPLLSSPSLEEAPGFGPVDAAVDARDGAGFCGGPLFFEGSARVGKSVPKVLEALSDCPLGAFPGSLLCLRFSIRRSLWWWRLW